MDGFKVLNADELAALPSKERRDYQKRLKEYNNRKMVADILDQEPERNDEVLTPKALTPETESEPEKPKKNTQSATTVPSKNGATKKQQIPKKTEESKKKQQITLTITSESKARLEGADADNYKRILSRYVDRNIDTIVEFIEEYKKFIL